MILVMNVTVRDGASQLFWETKCLTHRCWISAAVFCMPILVNWVLRLHMMVHRNSNQAQMIPSWELKYPLLMIFRLQTRFKRRVYISSYKCIKIPWWSWNRPLRIGLFNDPLPTGRSLHGWNFHGGDPKSNHLRVLGWSPKYTPEVSDGTWKWPPGKGDPLWKPIIFRIPSREYWTRSNLQLDRKGAWLTKTWHVGNLDIGSFPPKKWEHLAD